jgi:UPF0271 protein
MSRAGAIDLNADVGEGCGSDAELVPLVSSVNIACGAHAGDEASMLEALHLAVRHGAAIGAHPGFADREHFGRRELRVGPAEAAALVTGQTRHLQALAGRIGAAVGHVKLHGALYNMAAGDRALADAIASALAEDARRSGSPSVLVALAGSVLASAGREQGLRVIEEAFADRAYRRDGTLVPRSEPGAVVGEPGAASRQALLIAREGAVVAQGGERVRVEAGTLCIHGDSPGAVALARRIRADLAAAGIAVRPPRGR